MSTGVATTANASASPRLHTAAHRRRVGDFMDCEKSSDCYLLNGVDYDYDYDCDYDHNDHRVIRYLWLLRKMKVMRGLTIAQCLVSGRNAGRTIFAALMMMMVVSGFVKVSFIVGGGNVEEGVNWKRRETNGFLIRQMFNADSSMAQRVAFGDMEESSSSSSSSGSVMSKRLLEKYPATQQHPLELALGMTEPTSERRDPGTFDIRFEEAMGLGLLCHSLSSSPKPWLGIIPETRKIS